MKSTIRAFIAIDISPDVSARARKAIEPLRRAFPDVKWIEEDAFHLTLKFLGANVPTNEIHKIVAAVQIACNDVEPFELVFKSLGAFPDVGNPRTIWLGVAEGTPQLCRLARRISEELELLGYPHERSEFSPHITVGRTRLKDRDNAQPRKLKNHVSPRSNPEDDRDPTNYISLSRLISERANLTFGASVVESVVLYSSELDRTGASYDALAEIPLAPLGSDSQKNAPFQPKLYDDPSFKVDEEALDKHLPESLDSTFDIGALDAEVEEELRAICGDAFVELPSNRSNRLRASHISRAIPSQREVPTVKPTLPEPVDLDDVDLSEFEKTMAKEINSAPSKRIVKREK